jgi:peroxiredoxin
VQGPGTAVADLCRLCRPPGLCNAAFAYNDFMTPDTLADIALPAVPLTVEGASVLHQMMRVRWPAWRALSAETRAEILEEAAHSLSAMAVPADGRQTGLFSLLGHKGDLLFVHFRRSFEELNQAQLELTRLRLSDYLEPTTSYLSMIELGLYESTSKVYGGLAAKGVEPHSEEWKREIELVLDRQRQAMAPRLWPEIPPAKYICFYPMDRRRGESVNWYTEPMADRQRMMHEHGMVGRRYTGEVRQIITGSIGFDDWEWGVDLFADNPLVFKRLIYEMRFDHVSAVYALFGTFYVGLRVAVSELGEILKC